MSLPATPGLEAAAFFLDGYAVARSSLLEQAQSCEYLEDHHSIELSLDDRDSGERLTTEIFWLGPAGARKVLVLISATHGVEGFVGAAVQRDLLQRLAGSYRLPNDTAVLLLFALNPWGFVNRRRCDEQGIDLNRNFIDFDQPLPMNLGYRSLQQALYVEDKARREQLFNHYRQQYGQGGFEVAISGGQYFDPQGPFYGGAGPAHGRRVVDDIIEQYHLARRHLAVVDIHSGLGLYAHGEIINDHLPGSKGYEVANHWYGASVTAPAMGTSSSVTKLGLMDYRWHELMLERGCFVTLEFGTYSTKALFEVVLQDHRSWKINNAEAIASSANAMQAHFCPQDIYWRELVLLKARQVIQQALDGLQDE